MAVSATTTSPMLTSALGTTTSSAAPPPSGQETVVAAAAACEEVIVAAAAVVRAARVEEAAAAAAAVAREDQAAVDAAATREKAAAAAVAAAREERAAAAAAVAATEEKTATSATATRREGPAPGPAPSAPSAAAAAGPTRVQAEKFSVSANLDLRPPFPGQDMGANTLADEKPHAVCVPFPAQGHITPMMKLARVLHSKGFHVTFVNTEYNHGRLIRSRGSDAVAGLSDFRFATIPDGLPPSDADATQDQESLCYSTMTTCLSHLKNLLGDMNRADGVPPVRCVVADSIMSFSLDAAAELGVPCALFFAASACGYMGYHNFLFLIDAGLTPLKDIEQVTNGYLDTPVRCVVADSIMSFSLDAAAELGVPCALFFAASACGYMGYHNFPFLIDAGLTPLKGGARRRFHHQHLRERPALDAMRATLPAPVYTIGPLSLLAEQLVPGADGGPLATIRPSLWREDHSCLDWLRGREPRSVVYVNFGSITTMSSQDLVEFAWGLASCGYDFLWVIRNDLVKGDAAVLPPEFLEATEGRRLLASWCEQEAVLRHEAVGVFLTHCGWNSTLEGLSAGVPMLCLPFFAEQPTNTRYACMEWGVGMEVGDDVRREVVEARIREVMGGGEMGREMRRKAAEWSDIAARATAQPGGRSLANLESLLKDVLLMDRPTIPTRLPLTCSRMYC
ncbi:hypothetical protein ACQ4PT_034992 [Festuca glaucescens]